MKKDTKFAVERELREVFRSPEKPPAAQASSLEDREASKERTRIAQELQKLKDALPPIEQPIYRADGLLQGFSLRSYRIDCSHAPLGHNAVERTLPIVQGIISALERQKSILPANRPSTLVLTRGGECVEFDVSEGDAKKHYLATPHEVFLVVEARRDFTTAEERAQLPVLKKKVYELGIRTGQFRGDVSEAERERSRAEEKKLKEGEWVKLIGERQRLEVQEEFIEMKSHIRVLRNEETGAIVHEYSMRPDASDFFLERVLPGGVVRRDDYYWGGLRHREYLREGKRQSMEEYRNDNLVARHTYANGQLQKTDHLQVRGGVERATHITEHLPRETVLYPVQMHGEQVFLSVFGDRPLKPEETLAVITSLGTREAFDFFEEIYWKEFSAIRSSNDALREAACKRGRELYGVDKSIEEVEQFLRSNGVNFSIRFDSIEKGSRVKLREAVRVLPALLSALRKYPPQYFRNGSFRALSILGNLKSERTEGAIGFYDSQEGRVVISPTAQGDYGPENIFHHEYFHFDDDLTGGLNAHRDWVHRFHGNGKLASGEEVYGKISRTIGPFTTGVDRTNFARSYGRLNPNEDLATIAEELLVPRTYLLLQEKAKAEPILQEKIAAMKRRFFVRSLGRMDDRYWRDFQSSVAIDGAYWNAREQNGDFRTAEIHTLEQYAAARQQETRRLTYNSFLGEYYRTKDDASREQVLRNWREVTRGMVERDSYNRFAWAILGQTYLRLEQQQARTRPEQIALLAQRLRILPVADHEHSFYTDLAELYVADGQAQKAKECYERAIALFPRDFTLRENLFSLLEKERSGSTVSPEVIRQREQIFRMSGQKEHYAALRDAYLRAGRERDAFALLQEYVTGHFSDTEARRAYERAMIAQKREREVIAFYEGLNAKQPSVEVELALAKFCAYQISGAEGDRRFAPLLQTHREPEVLDAYFTFLRNWIRTKGKEKGREYFLQKLKEIHALIDATGDFAVACKLLSLVEEYGSTEERRRELLFMLSKFQQAFLENLSGLQGGANSPEEAERLRSYVRNYREHVIGGLSKLEKMKGNPETFLRVNQEYLDALGTRVDFADYQDASAFFALILQWERTDPKRALQLCAKYIEDRTWKDQRRSLNYQRCYLTALMQPLRWVRVEGEKEEYAYAGEENILYRRFEDGVVMKLKRWVAKADNFDQFEWGGYKREERCLEKELPQELKKKT